MILNLTQIVVQKNKVKVKPEKIEDKLIDKVVFIKYKNVTDRKLKELEKLLDRLMKKVKLKSRLLF
ncbi:MAG: hypothetical protein HQ517_03230 [SAR324 cluster bacterium]|nr:hypothetical protein [SAR324 cluster bacterium]